MKPILLLLSLSVVAPSEEIVLRVQRHWNSICAYQPPPGQIGVPIITHTSCQQIADPDHWEKSLEPHLFRVYTTHEIDGKFSAATSQLRSEINGLVTNAVRETIKPQFDEANKSLLAQEQVAAITAKVAEAVSALFEARLAALEQRLKVAESRAAVK